MLETETEAGERTSAIRSCRGGNVMYLGLGIDTGGTYTDAAIMDMSNGNVIESNKDAYNLS